MVCKVVLIEVLNRFLVTYVLAKAHYYLLPSFQVCRDPIHHIFYQTLRVITLILIGFSRLIFHDQRGELV